MRKFLNDILHQFDLWHFGKNIKKKHVKLAKKKNCHSLNQWIKAIISQTFDGVARRVKEILKI